MSRFERDESEDDKPEGLDADQATKLHKGKTLIDNNFQLSYNDDGGEYYYLKIYGEVHHLNYSFKKVKCVGEHEYHLFQEGQTGLFVNDIQHYPLLEKALITLHRNT